jgi:hypothetical protein
MVVTFKRDWCDVCFRKRWHEGAEFAGETFFRCVVCIGEARSNG